MHVVYYAAQHHLGVQSKQQFGLHSLQVIFQKEPPTFTPTVSLPHKVDPLLEGPVGESLSLTDVSSGSLCTKVQTFTMLAHPVPPTASQCHQVIVLVLRQRWQVLTSMKLSIKH